MMLSVAIAVLYSFFTRTVDALLIAADDGEQQQQQPRERRETLFYVMIRSRYGAPFFLFFFLPFIIAFRGLLVVA